MERLESSDELDSVDLRILSILQQDAAISTGEIADRIGISQSPCWRRIQRMRDAGIIRRQVAILDRLKFGQAMAIFAQVKVGRLSEADRESLCRAIRDIPEIVECHTVFGEMDLVLKVLAPDVLWYQEFIFGVLMKLPGVIDVHSIVTLVEMKCTTMLPLKHRKLR